MHWVWIFLCFFWSCSSDSKTSKRSLRIAFSQEPTSLDPRLAQTLNGSNICRMLFEGLMGFDSNGALVPTLAEQVQISEDHLVYEFHLRKAKWSDGSEVCAQDFIDSWKVALSPNFPAANVDQLFPIRGAKRAKSGEIAVDEIGLHSSNPSILIVELEAPTPYFLKLCSLPAYFPTPKGKTVTIDSWISNGPYLLDRWIHQDRIVLKKNPFYWASEQIASPSVELSFLEPETALQLFDADQLDWVGSPTSYLPLTSLPALVERGGYQKFPLLGTSFLRINTRLAKLSDAKVRQTLASAIHREELTEILLHGSQIPAYRFVPPVLGLMNPELIDKDLEKESLKDTVLSLLYAEDPRARSVVQAIQGQLMQELSIKVELEPAEIRVYYERIRKGEYELALGSWIADFDDPANFLDLFRDHSSSGNMTGWESKDYLEQLKLSDLCVGEERFKRLAEAEKILMREAPIIPIFHFQMNYLQKSDLKGIVLLPIGLMDYRWATIGEKTQ